MNKGTTRSALRALCFLVAFFPLIVHSGVSAGSSPKEILLEEDFGLGIQLGSTKRVLRKLPDYSYRVVFSNEPLWEGFFFLAEDAPARTDVHWVEPESSFPTGSLEAKKYAETREVVGRAWKESYLALYFSRSVLIGVHLKNFDEARLLESPKLFGVAVSELTPHRLTSIAPWLEDEMAGVPVKDPSTRLHAYTYWEIPDGIPLVWEMKGAYFSVWTRGEDLMSITAYYAKVKKRRRFVLF